MNNLKESSIKSLELKHPLYAHMLNQCELFPEKSPSGFITVHLFAPSIYVYEQLQSNAVWPKLHTAIMQALGQDFTLNFQKPTNQQHERKTS